MSDRRNVPRYQTELAASLAFPGRSEIPHVTVVTMAVAGCAVRGTDLPGPGSKCEFWLEWQGREIRGQAQVVWKNVPQNLVGLKFLSMDEASLGNLRALCATLRLQPLAHRPAEDESD